MTKPILTLALPESVYDELRQRAYQHQRRIEDEAVEALIAAVDKDDGLPPDLTAAITALAALDVDGLQRVSRSQPPVEDAILLDTLTDKRRRQGTNPDEDRLIAELIDRHDRVLVLRAEALALLARRGIDVTERIARA